MHTAAVANSAFAQNNILTPTILESTAALGMCHSLKRTRVSLHCWRPGYADNESYQAEEKQSVSSVAYESEIKLAGRVIRLVSSVRRTNIPCVFSFRVHVLPLVPFLALLLLVRHQVSHMMDTSHLAKLHLNVSS